MTDTTWRQPSLWRVTIFVVILALAVNVLLYPITTSHDWFTDAIAIASGVVAGALLIAWKFAPRYVDDLLLASMAIWIANAIEFAAETRWEIWVRQCGFYVAFALLSLGAYLARRSAVVE